MFFVLILPILVIMLPQISSVAVRYSFNVLAPPTRSWIFDKNLWLHVEVAETKAWEVSDMNLLKDRLLIWSFYC